MAIGSVPIKVDSFHGLFSAYYLIIKNIEAPSGNCLLVREECQLLSRILIYTA